MSAQTANANATNYDKELKHWVEQEKAAVELISCTGQLLYNKGV